MMIDNYPYKGIADAIAQLAVATASSRDTVATITATNANVKLTLQLKTSQAYSKKLKEEIVQLKLKIEPDWQGQ
jgi:predicted 2-oxoglutarate/Fe(II)-dependent dioxygenase YbiX